MFYPDGVRSRRCREKGVTVKLLVIPVLLCLILSGCAGSAAISPSAAYPEAILLWPPPPETTRIEWVQEIRLPLDAGVKKGFWSNLAEFFIGEEPTAIARPYGIFVDSSKRLYIVDPGGAVVHCYDKIANKYSQLRGTEKNPLKSPIGITGSTGGDIFVTDSEAGMVFRLAPGDTLLRPYLLKGLTRPTGIAFDRQSQQLYVSDTASHQIVVFDENGQEEFRIGVRGDGPGDFNYPTDITFDRSGRLIVTDALNFRIQILTSQGGFISMFGSSGDRMGYFSKPKGVTTDSDGNIYVADALLDAVQVFDREGRLLMLFGNRGSRPAEFWMPSGLFIAEDDTIYCADSYNNRIQLFRYRSAGEPVATPSALPLNGTSFTAR